MGATEGLSYRHQTGTAQAGASKHSTVTHPPGDASQSPEGADLPLLGHHVLRSQPGLCKAVQIWLVLMSMKFTHNNIRTGGTGGALHVFSRSCPQCAAITDFVISCVQSRDIVVTPSGNSVCCSTPIQTTLRLGLPIRGATKHDCLHECTDSQWRAQRDSSEPVQERRGTVGPPTSNSVLRQ